MLGEFYKKNPEDKIWWSCEIDEKTGEDNDGGDAFSFDKEKVFYLFRDYPDKLTPEEKNIFDKENPFWVEFFSE